ncbi:hypothetical protein B0A53_02414 [Rhodotorula sp. CCFEE 5036]|nr:hypothetical protein B0A53_02414 [Rhodotorula sp. CCFEE 5036]
MQPYDLVDEGDFEGADLAIPAVAYDDAGNEQIAQQQRIAEAAASQAHALEQLASVPEPVKRYLISLWSLLNQQNPNLAEIHSAYEQGWNRLSDKFFPKQEWPDAEVIAPLVNHDEAYCNLFNLILNSSGPVPLTLPIDWIYNIIDEFVYQYTSFALWRNKTQGKTEEEKAILAESGQVWSCYSVLNVLYSLIQKSKILDQLAAAQKGEDVEAAAGEYGSIPLYHHLGYFSVLALVRVHVLLGDYTLALSMLDHIELDKKALLTRVTAAHVSTYYYVGFAYLMLGRYPDAIRSFSHILFFVLRLKHFQRGSQFDQINKTADRMYALLAIAQALCPTKVDEGIATAMKDKFGDQYGKMVRGGPDALASFQELFTHGAPRFISPNPPPYESESDETLAAFAAQPDPSQHQLAIFLAAVEPQLSTSTLRSFLRLYTTLGTDKLAKFLDLDDEETVLEMLMTAKAAARKVTWTSGGLLEGEETPVSDINFGISEASPAPFSHGHLTVAQSTTSRRYGDFFSRHALKFADVYDQLRNKPLPVPKPRDRKPAPPAAAAAAGGAADAGRREVGARA